VSAEVRQSSGAAEIAAAMALRHAVFCDEQGVPLADELDGRDGDALHVVAVDRGAVVGTCRLLFEDGGVARLGRLAVARPQRGQGLGAAILAEAEARARAAGAVRMVLASRVDASGLYGARGYTERGDVFLDAGIEHITMEKDLA
jgi:predicted GNAT family N-acyltransferase